jgi:tetratricopeptide (TPR) repeat protein
MEDVARDTSTKEVIMNEDVGEVLALLGDTSLRAGRPHDARIAFERAAEAYDGLAQAAPQEIFVAMDTVRADAAAAELADGDVAAALANAQKALAREERRASEAPSDHAAVNGLGRAELVMGDVQAKRGDATAALAAYRAAHDAYSKVLAVSSDPLADPVNAAEADLRLARALGTGTASSAERSTLIVAARSALEGLAATRKLSRRGQDLLGEARAAAGK